MPLSCRSFFPLLPHHHLQLQLSLLESYHKEKKDTEDGSVKTLKELGADIRAAKYASELSTWQYPEVPAQGALLMHM